MRTDHQRRAGRSARRAALRLEELEVRTVPAIAIQIDYSRDTGFFTNNAEARATLERAAAELGTTLTASLAAIAPGGGNTWTATFFDPATGGQFSVPNLTVGANTIRVYVGARPIGGTEAGFGGPGGYGAGGSAVWLSTLQTRGHSGFAPWGGSITFDSSERWHFGTGMAGLNSNELDFYSVAVHELGHVLGIGTSAQWTALSSGGRFYGASATAVYGGAVPLAPDGAHWADGLTVGGRAVSLDPVLNYGMRANWSALDAAALRDLGWSAAPAPVPPPAERVPLGNREPVAVTGAGGTVGFYVANGAGLELVAELVPFAGYAGSVRVAAGDFDGDGTRDFAFATGAGPVTTVRVLSGHGHDLLPPTAVAAGYTNGVSLAAGDLDRDGRAELVMGTGAGFAPLVGAFAVTGGRLVPVALFVAFDAPGFGGGVRVAVGDLNRDGHDDIVATTASGVSAVAVYDGAAARVGVAAYLAPTSFVFGGTANGLSAAVGDRDGDGRNELVLGTGAGAALVAVWSGADLAAHPGAPVGAVAAQLVVAALPGTGGAAVAFRDVTGDGRAELVVATGGGSPAALALPLTGGASAVTLPPRFGTGDGVFVG